MSSNTAQPNSLPIDHHSTVRNERNEISHSLSVITEEERRVLKECERDSFYLRALPLSMGAMSGAYFMVKSGRWTPHPKYGTLPKMIIAGGFGYFVGKMSYLPTCQRKVLEKIPNSNLAAAIRKSKGLSPPEGDQLSPAVDDSILGRDSSEKYQEYSPSEGLDDRFRPSIDREVKEPSASQEKNSVTYDELRRRNRQEYEDSLSKRQKHLPSSPPASYKDSPFIPERHLPESKETPKSEFYGQPEPSQPSRKKRTTIWGDVIEE